MEDSTVMERVKNFQFDADDVLLCSYPRSGTTWSLELAWLVLNNADVETARKIDRRDRARFMEFKYKENSIPEIEYLEKTPPPRLIKTHLTPQYFEKQREQVGFKTIVVMRNLKDVMVSFFHFKKDRFNYTGTWDDFFNTFVDGKMSSMSGSWQDHCLKCWQLREDPKVLILKYEDMKRGTCDAVRTMADFCDKTLSEDQMKLIAEFASFDKMKERHFESDQVKNDPSMHNFFRKGIVGDSDSYFTEEQAQYVGGLLQRTTEKEGLVFTID